MRRVANDTGSDTSYGNVVLVGIFRWSEITCARFSSYDTLTTIRAVGDTTDGLESATL